jgi:hypothetical protein
MTIWEYKIDFGPGSLGVRPYAEQILKHLNERGEEGWELVTVLSFDPQFGKADCYIYKRPMPMKK